MRKLRYSRPSLRLISEKKHLYDKEQECQKISEALNNLQNVLEQFQAEQEQQIQSELLLLKTELSHHKSEAEKLRKEVVEFKEIQKRCQEAEQSVRELQEELSKKTRAFIKLQEDGTTSKVAFLISHTS